MEFMELVTTFMRENREGNVAGVNCVKELRVRSSPNPCSGRLSTITTGDLRNGAVGDFWDGVFGYFGDGTVED